MHRPFAAIQGLQLLLKLPAPSPAAPHGWTPASAAHGISKAARTHHRHQRPHHGCAIDAIGSHCCSNCCSWEGHHLPHWALLQETAFYYRLLSYHLPCVLLCMFPFLCPRFSRHSQPSKVQQYKSILAFHHLIHHATPSSMVDQANLTFLIARGGSPAAKSSA